MLYTYHCNLCDDDFTGRHPMGQAPDMVNCPVCDWTAERVLQMPNIHYKGGGFTGAGCKAKNPKKRR